MDDERLGKRILPTITQNRGWQAILFDCDCHSIDDVVVRLQEAIGCSEMQAEQYASLAKQFGRVTFFEGSEEDCVRVTDPLAAIGLEVFVEPR